MKRSSKTMVVPCRPALFRRLRTLPLFVFLLTSYSCPVHAQGLIETMTAQLAKLELQLKELQQGYSYVQQGLSTISSIKNGDFNLHSAFFNSLNAVNPAIRNWTKVADIIAMQADILILSANSLRQFNSSAAFSPASRSYLNAVYAHIKDLTSRDIDELTGLISDGNWQMSDDDRMHRIDQLYQRVADKQSFLHSFSARVTLEVKQRSQELSQFDHLRQIQTP